MPDALPNTAVGDDFQPLRWLWLSVVVIVLDQVTKLWALAALGDGQVIPLLPVFDFSLVYNTGAAFGFLANAGGWQKVFFVVVAAVVVGILLYWTKTATTDQRQQVVAYAFIIGGAIGNVIDRVRLDKVVDFIHVFYQHWHFPHFNIADIAITIGAALVIMDACKIRVIR